MSWLMRTGTGRNNISFGGNGSIKGKYFKRTANGRNNVQWINISSNGTHKLLERNGTGRNNVRWNNLTFSFYVPINSYLVADRDRTGNNMDINERVYDYNINISGMSEYRGMEYFINVDSYFTNGWNVSLNKALDLGGISGEMDMTVYMQDNHCTNLYNTLRNNYSRINFKDSSGNIKTSSGFGNFTYSDNQPYRITALWFETIPGVSGINMANLRQIYFT